MAKYKRFVVDIARIFDISIALNYKFAGLRETV